MPGGRWPRPVTHARAFPSSDLRLILRVVPNDERVVNEADSYVVVEKTGDAGDVAEEEDPR